jgi:uncharacterized protein YecT (DUF1311 family)
MRALAALALAMAVTTPAFAQTPAPVDRRYTPAYQQCLDKPEGQSTMGMIECVDQEVQVQDKALNAAYATAMGDLNDRQKTKLRAAQRAWVAFRDADCASLQDEDWGSLSRITANICVLQRTVERTIELEDYPDQGEPAE